MTTTCLHKQFDVVCNGMICPLGDLGFGYPWRYMIDKSAFNGMINYDHGKTSCFDTNSATVYSIMMVVSVFDDNLEKAHCQNEFDIIILTDNLE